jgi:Zn-dependent peptidase ImmA (M78 family)
VIELSGSASRERDRFSIAHELGHLFLHMGYLVDAAAWNRIDEYRDSPMFRHGHSEEELEAHEFAASFLMPALDFKGVAKRNYVANSYDVSSIARVFDVSVPAARNRGRWLGMFSWD